MPALDSNVPHKWHGDGAITITDGSGNSVDATVDFFQECSWSETPPPFTEAKNRGKRLSTPVAMQTGDGECELNLSFIVTSLKGVSVVHPYEALKQTGTAASWTPTIDGDKYSLQIDILLDSSAGSVGGNGGGLQTLRFPHCIPGSISLSFQDGLLAVEATFTVLADGPTIV